MRDGGIDDCSQPFNTPVLRIEDQVIYRKIVDIDRIVGLVPARFAPFAFKCQLLCSIFVGNLVPEHELGEVGLLDLVESVRANQRRDGEYVVFLEDDAKAKVVMFRWKP